MADSHGNSNATTSGGGFTSLPTLSYAQSQDSATKPEFLAQLRAALLDVGFLYLKDFGASNKLLQDVKDSCKAFFEELSDEEKLKVEMVHKPSFLGYSRLGDETTAHKQDWREQVEFAYPGTHVRSEDEPLWYNLLGPNQWPTSLTNPRFKTDSESLNSTTQFRRTFETYMKHMTEITDDFTRLIAEAIGLPSNAFNHFFKDGDYVHKLKLVKYPDFGKGIGQGVGPHKDSMLSSYLLQASHHRGLQVQNKKGEWIDVPPVDGTVVVAIGQGMEAITGGVVTSTTHRVLSPEPGSGCRYSLPFFQGVSLNAKFDGLADQIPEDVKRLKQTRNFNDKVENSFDPSRSACMGQATLNNRVKSHVDVGQRWYPDLLSQLRADQARPQVEVT